MPPDDDEITRPGTPDALRDMHEIQRTLGGVLARLDAICTSLERIESSLANTARDSREARAESKIARDNAQHAAQVARFTEKRVDVLVSRVQRLENGQR